ncbi:MAG TPA: ABC transporter ATP-binding protein [Candidatus Competibacteraceae bacterium]|nr:ABC transporter ATP-binding protein [Candidatus Competibacteraceae bacterium]
MIRVDDLHVRFASAAGPVDAVKGVSFRVQPGEVFGLVGESGSGKSTVLRALAGLAAPWQGRLWLAGAELGRHRDRAFCRRVQMVFQDPYGSLHPRFTVDRTLAEALAIHRLDERAARIARVLEDVGLGLAFRFRYPHQLSGGQRQRVAIARALILQPQVLLLDEPTSALDVSVQAEILNLLVRLRAEHGLTMLLVSHNLAVVGHLCQRLAVMRQGEIVETLTVEQLRRGAVDHPYTRGLLLASRGYDRRVAEELLAAE